MDNKAFVSGSVGFVVGITVTLLVSFFLMSDMMWRGGMIRGWQCNGLNSQSSSARMTASHNSLCWAD